MIHARSRSACMRWLPVVALTTFLALLLLAAPALGARVSSGPATVTPGQRVVVTAVGFPAGAPLAVDLAPTATRGGNCCGVRAARARANAAGKARFVFRWPAAYNFCAGPGDCSKDKWVRQRADIFVLTRSGVSAFARRTTLVTPAP